MLFDIASPSPSHDRRQINRATIGEGEIIIRSDPAAGLEGLNRDLAKAQEITKNEKTSVTVYIDSAAIEEIMNGGKGIKKNFKDLAQAVKDLLPEDAVREREAITGQQDVYEELLANGMEPEDAAKVLEENPLVVTCLIKLSPYITEDGELNISEEEASKLLDGLTDPGVVSFNVADNSAKITYLSDKARAKLQFWAAVGAVRTAGASAVAALQFANDLAGETLYYASGGSLYQAEHESFHQTVNDVAEAVESLVTNPMDVGSAVVQDYVSRYEQYEDLTAQGKYKEAGEVLGALTFEVGETLLVTGSIGKAVLKKTTKLAGMLKGVGSGNTLAKVSSSLLAEMKELGVKFTPEEVIFTHKMSDGKIVFLEEGNSAKGLKHIYRHLGEFETKGIFKNEIPQAILQAIKENNIVGYQGKGTGRPIYEFTFKGKQQRLAITVGSNGFVVGANPQSIR